MSEIKVPQFLYGRDTEILLDNSNRGFRLETAMNVNTGENGARGDAIKWLDYCFEKYADDRPLVTQQYFYLTDYIDRDLDNHAFEVMQNFFDHCRKREYEYFCALHISAMTENGQSRTAKQSRLNAT